MKNFLTKLGKFCLKIILRIAFLVLSFILWPVFIATTLVFVPLEFVTLLVILPLLWVFIGTNNVNKLGDFLFKRYNKELWHTDYSTQYDADRGFWSFVPMWGFYVQENWLCKLIPDDIETND